MARNGGRGCRRRATQERPGPTSGHGAARVPGSSALEALRGASWLFVRPVAACDEATAEGLLARDPFARLSGRSW
jgi:hypothetical protein